MSDSLIIAGRSFRSRLIVGTGKYKSFQETARALEASGAEMVTVAVRRVNLDRSKESLLDYIDAKKYFLLPNTAGCYTADEAIRAARLGREVGLSDWVKLEVIGDQATLYPDVQATLEATRVLVKEGFTVLPYTSDDIVFAKRLIDAGAATIMPLGAPIGSGMGIQNQAHIRILREMITGVPLIVDAGVGTASDAAIAMELGADAVLMNTGIANAQDPVLMAEAMHHAVLAGRQAYLSGRMPKKLYATASSPLKGVVREVGVARAPSPVFVCRYVVPIHEKRAARKPPSTHFNSQNRSKHLHAIDMNRIALHRAGGCDVVAFVSFERVRIVDHQDLLIPVGHDHHFRSRSQALLGARLSPGIGALSAALIVDNPSLDGSALSHVIERQCRQGKNET
jgi:thiazole synthase